jgi:tRNA threonylcarbamoyladenosine biosynthesis protein TsaE
MGVQISTDLKETIKLLQPTVQSKVILGLIGDLGFGKTTLVSELLSLYGCQIANSPTFSLVNRYQLNNGLNVYHIDLYRLKNAEEIDAAGFWDLFSDEEAFFIIEWVDRIDVESLPLNFKKIIVSIEKNLDSTRSYFINSL